MTQRAKPIIPPGAGRAEARRIRRRREDSVQAGQGHGGRIYQPVRVANRLATENGRLRRQDELARREGRALLEIETLRKRAAQYEYSTEKRTYFTTKGRPA